MCTVFTGHKMLLQNSSLSCRLSILPSVVFPLLCPVKIFLSFTLLLNSQLLCTIFPVFSSTVNHVFLFVQRATNTYVTLWLLVMYLLVISS